MPVGTKVDFSVDNGKIVSGASQVVLNTNGNTATSLTVAQYPVTLDKDTTASFDGNLTLKVEPKNGPITTFQSIALDDRPLFITFDLPTSTTFNSSVAFNLSGTAIDPEDGDISANITWTSDIDGALGTGKTVNVNTAGSPLNNGGGASGSSVVHTITASITDSDSNIREVTKAITIKVP